MNARLVAKSTGLVVWAVAVSCFLAATESKPDEPTRTAARAADTMQGKAAGQVRDDNGLNMKLVWCPPGAVAMGQVGQSGELGIDDEADDADAKDEAVRETGSAEKSAPVRVFLTRGYWLGKYEVTQSQWRQVMQTEPWKGKEFTKEGADFPATFVSWQDAMEFCRKLTKQERDAARLPDDWEYTLPTEAQWERACRARTETRFSFGDDESRLGEYAWICENTLHAKEPYAHRVGQKKPNPWGLYDMHGNVLEWCRDSWSRKLPGGRDPEVEGEEPTGETGRIVRGGGWGGIVSWSCQSSERFAIPPRFHRSAYYGFRVALSSVRQVGRTE